MNITQAEDGGLRYADAFASSPLDFAHGLDLDTTVGDLDLFRVYLSPDTLGKEAKQVFSASPLLPGILLIQHGQLVGMISRQQFFTRMSQPYSLELFLRRPIQAIHAFMGSDPLVLHDNVLVTDAAQKSLQRATDSLYEPIVIEHEPGDYSLLDMHHLLLAQADIHRFTTVSLQQKTQDYLYQTEKMSLLGQTVAGVSHEIKNPVNCITGNLSFLGEYTQKLVQLLTLYKQEFPQSTASIQTLEQAIELDFILEDFPQMLESLDLASTRLVNLTSSIRNFSRIDREEREPIDLHKYLDGTLLILNSQVKQGIYVRKHYGDIPAGVFYPGQISQVFMNILSNSMDALLEKQKHLTDIYHKRTQQPDNNVEPKHFSASPNTNPAIVSEDWQPRIDIFTYVTTNQRYLGITIADNGDGIPESIQEKIFEPFFTTKGIEQGTGLGLAISRQIITNHAGTIKVRSTVGQGASFEILLPLVTQD